MTIRELYNWAISMGVEDSDIVVRDYAGSQTSYIEPIVIHHKYPNGVEYDEVEL